MTRRRDWLAALISLGAAFTPALWAGPGVAQDQRAFPILKRLEQAKQAEAMELLRASQRCVNGARNLRALHECHRQERDREWEQRERYRRQIEAVRARYDLRRPGEEPPGRRPPPPPSF